MTLRRLSLPQIKTAIRKVSLDLSLDIQATLRLGGTPDVETLINSFAPLHVHCAGLCHESFTRLILAISDDLCEPLLALFTGSSNLRFRHYLIITLWDILLPDKPGVYSIYPKCYLEVMPGSPWFSEQRSSETILNRPLDDEERSRVLHIGLITRKMDNDKDDRTFYHVQAAQLPLFPLSDLEIQKWFTTAQSILYSAVTTDCCRRDLWMCMRAIVAPSLLRGRLPRWVFDYIELKLSWSSPFLFRDNYIAEEFIKLVLQDLRDLLNIETRETTSRKMMTAYSDCFWLSEYLKFRWGNSFTLEMLSIRLEYARDDDEVLSGDVRESIKRALLMGETDLDPQYRLTDLLRCVRALCNPSVLTRYSN